MIYHRVFIVDLQSWAATFFKTVSGKLVAAKNNAKVVLISINTKYTNIDLRHDGDIKSVSQVQVEESALYIVHFRIG